VTLANRVSAFFLGWLGLSLAGFAVAVYLVARADLYREADARLEGTLDALGAAADIEPEGIEWEGPERSLPRGDGSNAVLWLIAAHNPSGDRGQVIDRSGPAAGNWLLADSIVHDPSSGAPWRVARRRLDAGQVPGRVPDARTLAAEGQRVIKYRTIEIVAGVPLTPIHDELRRLAVWLALPTIGVWLIAALLGRWLCRRTLAPVAEMAASARAIGPTAKGERLVVRPTGDELAELGRAFNGALDRLEEAFERQRRFTGDAAHQLRTPLATVLGQVEVALRRDRDTAEYRTTLTAVADEVRHLHRLTEALLFLARADAEAAHPDLSELDLGRWVTDHVDRWRAARPDARVDVVVDGAVPLVRAHPELLAQLLDNLLDNAVKYDLAGSLIVVRVRAQVGGAELAVEDAGPGISPEDLPHVFDPFFRSAAARAAGVRGVGLGLAIARRIAGAMGATITAESTIGRGSRFAVRFPARPA
jgi:two-component system, OmpR family, sensor kinase